MPEMPLGRLRWNNVVNQAALLKADQQWSAFFAAWVVEWHLRFVPIELLSRFSGQGNSSTVLIDLHHRHFHNLADGDFV